MNYRTLLLITALLFIACSASAEFMTNYTFDSVTSSNNQGVAYIAIKADDMNLATSAQGYEGAGQHYSWTGDFGAARYIEGYNITMDSGFIAYAPFYFTISGSNDNINYFITDYVTGTTPWVSGVNKTFGMYNFTTNQTSYRYVRYDSIQCRDAANPSLTEIKFYNKGNVPISSQFTMVNTTPMVDHVNTNFTDLSFASPAVSTWNWSYQGIDAGNNTKIIFSTIPSPQNIRFDAGNWSIKLNVTNSIGYSETTTPSWINVTQPQLYTLYSNFTAVPTNPTVFETAVAFIPENNWSANRFQWDFGDGETFLSHNGSVRHVYSSPGLKTVSLTSYVYQNTSISNSTTRTDYISASYNTTYVSVGFSGTPTTGSPGLLVQFTDATVWGNTTSSGRIYNWTFGDQGLSATPYSSEVNPQHVYGYAGTYTVTLKVNNTADPSLGSNTTMKANYIVVSNNQNSQNTWWTPHVVKVTTFDSIYGNKLANVNVTAIFNETSMPGSWVTDLYGIRDTPAAEMLNGSLRLGGTTGSDGTLSFTMLGSIKYDIYLTSAEYGLNNYHIQAFPSDSMLNLYVPTNAAATPVTGNSTYQALNQTRVYFYEPDINNVTMCIDYMDTSGATISVTDIWKFTNNNTVMNATTIIPGVSLNTACYTVRNVRGTTVWWGYNATRVT